MTNVHLRASAIHEAGHAVAMVDVGLQLHGVHIRTHDDLIQGNAIVTSRGERWAGRQGIVESTRHVPEAILAITREQGGVCPLRIEEWRILADIAALSAGSIAEARYVGASAKRLFHLGAQSLDDRPSALEVAALHPLPGVALRKGWAIARDIIESRWDDVASIADLVHANRFTDGARIHAFLGAEKNDQVPAKRRANEQ